MTETVDREKLNRIVAKWAKEVDFPLRVYLFGSRLTGWSIHQNRPAKPGSDLDLAIQHFGAFKDSAAHLFWILDQVPHKTRLAELLKREFNYHEYRTDCDASAYQIEWYHPDYCEDLRSHLNAGSLLIYDSQCPEEGD